MLPRLAAAAAVLALALTGCSSTDSADQCVKESASSIASTPSASETGPDWPEWKAAWGFSPIVRDLVRKLAKQGKCAALQEQFNNADANSTVSTDAGRDPVALMTFIDDVMREAGCYK